MDKKKTLKIGRSEFGLIVKNGHYFVDKTKLIYDFYTSEDDVLLMTRPKRFGKTLNLSMIEHFFDIQKPESAQLFSEFEIEKNHGFCAEHQNKYPVINISLKDVKAVDWEACREKFRIEIADMYSKHEYLLQSEKLSEIRKENFGQILRKEASQAQLEYSLKHLSEYLKIHNENEVIILVDEYDAPIVNAFNNTNRPIKSPDKENKTYYERTISFMQTFLGKAFKGNIYLHKGLLTGVMRVGKESIFSEWNNFSVFGITMPYYFADSFGFTEQEIEKLLAYYGLQDQMESVQKWYDGYQFGNVNNIYNPWSIVNYITKNKVGFKPYWVNVGDYSLIKSRITEQGVQEMVQTLIKGKTIDKELKENFVFQDFERNTELLWTLLTDSGYLTAVEKSKYGNYKLRIPNNEVKIVFTDIIVNWLDEELKITRDLLIKTSESLINNKLIEFEAGFKQIVGDTLSYFDTAEPTDRRSHKKFARQEQIFHVYTLGLLAILSDDFQIKSNRESGEGRYDIMLIPRGTAPMQNGVVIEIKSTEKQKENETAENFGQRINREIDHALQQIEQKRYYKELIDHKIKPEKILRIPIVFAGKEPYINKLSE